MIKPEDAEGLYVQSDEPCEVGQVMNYMYDGKGRKRKQPSVVLRPSTREEFIREAGVPPHKAVCKYYYKCSTD